MLRFCVRLLPALALCALPTLASAQTPAPPYACVLIPYNDVQGSNGLHIPFGVYCTYTANGTATPLAPTVYKFTEGVVHAPGSELAWLVLANFDDVPQTVLVSFLVQGSTQVIWRTATLPAHGRVSMELHTDPSFDHVVGFSTRVYWPGDGDAQLVLRPAADPFSRATLPPPTVTRP